MSVPQSQRSLPTLDNLNATLPDNLDAKRVATEWFQNFAKQIEAGDASGVSGLLLEHGAFWRDMLALTWDFRTIEHAQPISRFLQSVLPSVGFTNLQLKADSIVFQQPYPDLAWIQGQFSFETRIGIGSGVFRIVPTGNPVEWKGHVVYTNLEELKGFPERIGALRDPVPNHGLWPEKRRRETAFEDREPSVVVIGGGQSGLEIAARLKLLDVPTLIVEKQARIGDQWRGRYEALCLHDPVWYDHMPYMPFPPSWPVWTPAPKLADWLESYANFLELDIWLSATVEKFERAPGAKGWVVTVVRADGTKRQFTPRHVIFAHGFGGGLPNMPSLPGMNEFSGKIIHSSQHKSARDHVGKKVVVVGACTSGHDLAHDHYKHGVDTTIYQRSSTCVLSTKHGVPRLFKDFYWEGAPPTDVADRIFASYPNNLLRLMHQRVTRLIAEDDKELLASLEKRGFRLNFGSDGSGFLLKAYERGGGYYLDVGASSLIADGKIKLKNDSAISGFSKDAIVFENGSTLPADVVIFATGFGSSKALVAQLAGEEIASQINDVWGLNEEGEINTAWRWSGVPGLYFMMGNLALCRYHSKHLALLIKAQEEGLYDGHYEK